MSDAASRFKNRIILHLYCRIANEKRHIRARAENGSQPLPTDSVLTTLKSLSDFIEQLPTVPEQSNAGKHS